MRYTDHGSRRVDRPALICTRPSGGADMTVQTRAAELAANDLAHLIHPLYHPKAQEGALIMERGEGIYLWDVNGNRYIDALSCLWNVNVGHGRQELADAAQRQMAQMAFCNSYTGFSNPPAIELATRL